MKKDALIRGRNAWKCGMVGILLNVDYLGYGYEKLESGYLLRNKAGGFVPPLGALA